MKVLLFDADGVLTKPEELFSIQYARSRGLDIEPFDDFFKTQWQDIVTGRKDLKESITENPSLWEWGGTADELVDYWCKAEDIRNEEMLKLIRQTKASGTPCYLATDQEKYRGDYMREVMFPGIFDHYFISSELGCTKTERVYFQKVMEYLAEIHPGVTPADVVFFDDSQSKIDTAKEFGFDARLFESVDQVRIILLDDRS